MTKILFFLSLFIWGCASSPEKNLSTPIGMIAAHFNMKTNEVDLLNQKGLNTDDIIQVLIISAATYLSNAEIIVLMENGKTIQEIASDHGLTDDFIEKRAAIIKRKLPSSN
ncbi:hypothetical protein ACFLTD_01545 [Elusimicrobiota bacterium]